MKRHDYCMYYKSQLPATHLIIFTGNNPPPPQQYQSPPGYSTQQYPPATEPQAVQVNSTVACCEYYCLAIC